MPYESVKIVTASGEKHNGRITGVTENSLSIEGKEVPFSEVATIRLRNRGRPGFTIGGLFLGIAGLLGIGLGFLIAYAGARYDPGTGVEGCLGVFVIILLVSMGIMIGVAGALIFILGGIGVLLGFAGGKNYRMGRWRIRRR